MINSAGSFDVIVVGSGFSGAVVSEQMASQLNKRVLVLEQRPHIGGNCYDFQNEHGIMVHRYGPHLFHTDNEKVWNYLSRFTDWIPYEHRVLASVMGQLVPMPVNLTTLSRTYPHYKSDDIEQVLLDTFGYDARVPVLELRKNRHNAVKTMAEFIYRTFFVNYTAKQWGCSPEEISPLVTKRVSVVVSRDDRYFRDKYQAVPSGGYARLIHNVLDHPNITVMTNTDGGSLIALDPETGGMTFEGVPFAGLIIYTGMVDRLFEYREGELPYRSLKFEFETLDMKQFQPATVVNYPNDQNFTRITEFKHILNRQADKTTIVREYPVDYNRDDPDRDIPYYTIFNDKNLSQYRAYRSLANRFPSLFLVGRLAEYKYYNMDEAVENALDLVDGMKRRRL